MRDFGVYPRACGGTHTPRLCRAAISGLSPRVRGNPHAEALQGRDLGSIPARAGEPHRLAARDCAERVYPRACGGTARLRSEAALMIGLSPRVRGNRRPSGSPGTRAGSIPARAGEPHRVGQQVAHFGVYPRACGGTTTWHQKARMSGSIPARAGEPRPPAPSARSPRVYPRACGGTRNCNRGSIPARAGEPWRASSGTSPSTVYPRACGGTMSLTNSG